MTSSFAINLKFTVRLFLQDLSFGICNLGPLLFNACICDLSYDIDDIDFASFADDKTPYFCLSDVISVLGQLKGGIDKTFDWFKKNILKGNADKYHLITSSKTPVGIEMANITVISGEKVKLLGIQIGNRLNFDYHISQLFKKAGKKIACSNSSFQIHGHFATEINYKYFYNVSVLILSFNLDVS